MMKHKRLWLILGLTPMVIVLGLAVVFFKVMHPLLSFDPAKVPPITANPIDADKVFAVSQFRSGSGHDYSYGAWDGETCRSMKHYFNFGQNNQGNMPVRSKPGPGETNINIYAPFDGKITANEAEHTPIGTQVHIASSKDPHFFVRLFHIDLLPSLKVGSSVKSGQLVGTIGPKDGMDVSYEANYRTGKVIYLSIFDHMTTEAFAPYARLGHQPSEFVLSRQQADAKGYQCSGEQFVNSNQSQGTDNNGVPNGYVSLRPNPYASQSPQQQRQ